MLSKIVSFFDELKALCFLDQCCCCSLLLAELAFFKYITDDPLRSGNKSRLRLIRTAAIL